MHRAVVLKSLSNAIPGNLLCFLSSADLKKNRNTISEPTQFAKLGYISRRHLLAKSERVNGLVKTKHHITKSLTLYFFSKIFAFCGSQYLYSEKNVI